MPGHPNDLQYRNIPNYDRPCISDSYLTSHPSTSNNLGHQEIITFETGEIELLPNHNIGKIDDIQIIDFSPTENAPPDLTGTVVNEQSMLPIRKYEKPKRPCPYCQRSYSRVTDHILAMHTDKDEIRTLIDSSPSSKKHEG